MKNLLVVVTRISVNELNLKRIQRMSDEYEVVLLNLSDRYAGKSSLKQFHLTGGISVVDAFNLLIEHFYLKNVEDIFFVSLDLLDEFQALLQKLKFEFTTSWRLKSPGKIYMSKSSKVLLTQGKLTHVLGSVGCKREKSHDFVGTKLYLPLKVYGEIGGIIKRRI